MARVDAIGAVTVDVPMSAQVVVIGGGAMGAATAFHLARRGITDVVVLERDTLASGSTSKSAGGVRLQFADELNLRIMLRSLPEFERFAEVIGEYTDDVPDLAFRQVGYLFLLTDPADVTVFRDAVTLQQSLGIATEWVDGQAAADMVPGLLVDDVIAATYHPREGHCSPEALVVGYVNAARSMGVRLRQGATVSDIDVADGRVAAVRVGGDRIACEHVVVAAGAWSGEVAALAGVDVPVTPERRHMWFTPSPCGQRDTMPMTIDFASSFYAHREGPGLVFGGRESTLDEVGVQALCRLPAVADAPIASTWSGFYEVSPDHNAIVGAIGGIDGLWTATGFSGHGFQQAPAIGEHLAELIIGAPPSLDLSAFTPQRFVTGALRAEHFVV
jgi:sarcosine oxidase, subunit beta